MKCIKAFKVPILIFLCLAAITFESCKKDKKNTSQEQSAPVKAPLTQADTEIHSSIDVTLAGSVVHDFIMMAGFTGENYLSKHFFSEVPGTSTSSSGTTSAVHDSVNKVMSMTFNKTKCMDGRLRNGSVAFDCSYDPSSYPGQLGGANYFRNYGFACKVLLSSFSVNEWLVSNDGSSKAILYNTVTIPDYSTKDTKLTWVLKGRFKFVNQLDTNRNMVWDGEISQTLDNTDDPAVLATDKKSPINWSLAKISFKGSSSGSTLRNLTYTFSIDETHPMKKTYSCSLPTTYTISPTEYHPFIDGLATLKVSSSQKQRDIFFGSSDFATALCNDGGIVLIEGTAINIIFK